MSPLARIEAALDRQDHIDGLRAAMFTHPGAIEALRDLVALARVAQDYRDNDTLIDPREQTNERFPAPFGDALARLTKEESDAN